MKSLKKKRNPHSRFYPIETKVGVASSLVLTTKGRGKPFSMWAIREKYQSPSLFSNEKHQQNKGFSFTWTGCPPGPWRRAGRATNLMNHLEGRASSSLEATCLSRVSIMPHLLLGPPSLSRENGITDRFFLFCFCFFVFLVGELCVCVAGWGGGEFVRSDGA